MKVTSPFTDFTNLIGVTNKKRMDVELPEQGLFDINKAGPREVLFAAERNSRQNYSFVESKVLKNIVVIGIIIVLILIAMQEFFLILAILSLIFVAYSLSSTPPQKVKYEITTHGIQYDEQSYLWNEFTRFFFTERPGSLFVAVDIRDGVPARLFLPINKSEKAVVKEALSKFLPYLESEPVGFMDNLYNVVVDRFDFDTPAEQPSRSVK